MFGKGRGLTLRPFRGKSTLSRRTRHPFLKGQGRSGQSAQFPSDYPDQHTSSSVDAGQPQTPRGPPPTAPPSARGSKWYRSFIGSRAQQTGQPASDTGSGHTVDWRNRFPEWKDIGKRYRTVTDSVDLLRAGVIQTKLTPLPQDELDHLRKHGVEFGKMLGAGGYGSVWLVTLTKNYDDGTPLPVPKQVACKIMNLLTFGQEGSVIVSKKRAQVSLTEAVRKLKRETIIHNSLRHRNIVKCEHISNVPDKETGFPFVRRLAFMELCQGDLRHLIFDKPGKKFTESEALDMFRDVSAGLKYLHDKNICHFDIKTNNVMYVEEGGGRICYKLADFGLSKKFDTGMCYYTHSLGTPAYMAPEMMDTVFSGKPYNAKATDIYSLGLVLAETIIGINDWSDFIYELRDRFKPEADIFNDYGVPPLCGQLIAWMARYEPDKRPTIDEVLTHPWLTSN